MFLHEASVQDTISAKDGEQLTVSTEWSGWLATELVDKTQQVHIKKWVPDTEDAIYFISPERARRWYAIDAGLPLVVSLGTATLELAGVAWISNVGIRNKREGYTLGIRVYDGYREQGLGTELGRRVHGLFDEKRRAKVHFRSHVANQAAFSLGIGLGYRMEEGRHGRELDMVRRPPSLL